MICHVVCMEIEKALEEAGVPNNKNHRIIDYFLPYRLKRDLETNIGDVLQDIVNLQSIDRTKDAIICNCQFTKLP